MPNLPRRQQQPEGEEKPQKTGVRSPALALVGRVFIILTLVCVITGCIVASVLTVYILRYIDSEDTLDLNDIKLGYTTILYAEDEKTGNFYELQRIHGDENRIWVDYEEIPQNLVNAAISLEDKRFATHQGVDWKRTFSSFVNLFIPIYEGKPGGSTITQQLVKNVTEDDETRIDRKVREIFRAIKLEKKYTKEQVMEAYLNTISLGYNTRGVQAAANLYFDKDVSELSLGECAAIISITQNPTKYNPILNLENLKVRQRYTLDEMLKQNHITQEEYDAAIAEELVIATESADKKINTDQSWFVDQVIEDVIDDLVAQKGYTREYASEQLLKGGYRIYTTVDEEMQDYLEKKFNIESGALPGVNNAEYPEGAFVVMDLNGQIKAITGSTRTKEGARLFSRARDAIRHPGSTIKPIATYAPAVERDLITFSTVIEDSPIMLNGKAWPSNFYGGYLGNVPVDLAIRRSTNTIPVKLQQQLGVENTFRFLTEKLGMSTLIEKKTINGKTYSDIALAPLALGEMTEGVTPLSMAGAYQIFGNGGLYTKPYSYTKVLDAEGNVILENNPTPVRAISAETATIMNRLMQGVTRGAQGTGTTAPFSAMPVAGKTGTSDNDNNQWFIGVTPYYVGVCWLGYDIPERINYAGHGYGPPIIWKNIMGPIHQNLPIIQFQESPNVITMEFCPASGMAATDLCPTRQIGWYKKTNTPEPCTLHSGEGEGEGEGEGGENGEGTPGEGTEGGSSSSEGGSSGGDNGDSATTRPA